MTKIADFFIKNDKFTIILSLLMAVGGLLGLKSLNSESYPAVDFATAVILTNYSGASAEDIETLITKPLEDEIKEVKGLKDVRSISKAGESKITVRIDMDNENVQEVMTEVEKAIDRTTDLPRDLRDKPSFTEIKSEEFPAIELALIGPNTNRKRHLLADRIKEELEDNDSVLNVRLIGYSERQFHIFLHREKMDQFHISFDEVLIKMAERNQNIPGGDLESDATQNLIRLEAKIKDPSEIENILLRSNFTGNGIYLKDIGFVEDSYIRPKVLPRFGDEEATFIIVNKKGGSDTIALVEDVEKALMKFQDHDPQLKLVVYNNEAEKVKKRLEVLSSNALTGLLLVVIFLFIFLPGRIGLMASLSLPLAVMATFGLMPLFGMNLDTITILALVIALGMLVDNSVVISENYSRLRAQGFDKSEAARESIRLLWLPITSTAFTTIAAFLPMLVTSGIMGEFIKYIPMVVTIALLISLVESFFLLPMRLTLIDTDKIKSEDHANSGWYAKILGRFEAMTRTLIKFRWWAALSYFVIISFSIYLMVGVNKFILFPAEQTEIYLTRFEAKVGTPLEVTDKLGTRLLKDIKQSLGDKIEHITVRVGVASAGPADPSAKSGDHVGLIIIYVTDETSIKTPHTQILESLRDIKAPYLETVSSEALINGPPVGEPVNATLRSNDKTQLNKLSVDLIQGLSKIEGVYDAKDDLQIGKEEVHVILDYDKVDRLGLSARAVGSTIRSAIDGNIVSNVNLLNKEVDLKVQLFANDRKDINDLKQIKIRTPQDHLVPIGQIAQLEQRQGSPIIKRFDFKRSKTITAQIEETKITSQEANEKLVDLFNKKSNNYPDVSMIFGGEAQNTAESMASLQTAMLIALMCISALLVFMFNSYLRPLIIMSTIPLGLIGVSIAFYLHGRPMSFMALIGVIGLAGIIVNSGIILISFIEELRAKEEGSLIDILTKASGIRLKAIMVTSLTTISGLLPTAYGIGGSDPTLIPMTMAMAWGLTSGTFLTLLWVPCAYAIIEDISDYMSALFKGKPKKAAY